MDDWLSYVVVFAAGFGGGVLLTTLDHVDEMAALQEVTEELSIHKEVDALMRKAGVDEWCELVLSGEITPVED